MDYALEWRGRWEGAVMSCLDEVGCHYRDGLALMYLQSVKLIINVQEIFW